MLKFITLLFLIVFDAQAQSTVDIFGAADTASGKKIKADFSFKEQNEPVFIIDEKPNLNGHTKQKSALPIPSQKEIHQLSAQNPKPFSISPQKEQNEIENTLYEGGNRIYDVQSFPIDDIKTITEPNIDPTISTYPEY